MAKRILFIHSAGPQGPNEGSTNLVKFLRSHTGKEYRIVAPDMPDPSNPSYSRWKAELENQLDNIDDEIILVGHSLGGSILLKYFSEMPCQKTISGLFVIASPFWKKGNGWDPSEFMLKPNFASHLVSIPKIFFYHSADDEVVPFSHMHTYSEKIPTATFRELKHGGHVFDDGIPQLITDLLTV